MARKLSVNAEYFVKRVETMLRKRGHDGLERLACRFLTGEDVKVAAFIWAKLKRRRDAKAGGQAERTSKPKARNDFAVCGYNVRSSTDSQ
jgi:hypothetical protein